MILGIGLDLVKVERIRAALEKESFRLRIYTEAERAYLLKKSDPSESAAGMWAAKEAALKALGTGVGPASLIEAEVLHEENGRPILRLCGRAKIIAEEMGVKNVFLSITHTDDTAAAQVILEG